MKTNQLQHKDLKLNHTLYIAIGILLSYAVLWSLLHYINLTIWFTLAIGIGFLWFVTQRYQTMNTDEKHNVVYIIIMCFIAVVFFVLYAEQSTLIPLYAEKLCHYKLFGITIRPSAYTVFDAFWILLLSLLVTTLFKKTDKENRKNHLMIKFGLGLLFTAIGFLFLYIPLIKLAALNLVNSLWIAGSFAFQGLGELFISAMGLYLMAKWAPNSIYNALMGGWFIVIAAGSSLAGIFNSHLFATYQYETVINMSQSYKQGLWLLILLSFISGLVVLACIKWICKKLSPVAPSTIENFNGLLNSSD